jgi:hypothetical protein
MNVSKEWAFTRTSVLAMVLLKNAWMLKSNPYPEMIKIISQLKKQHGLKLAVVSKAGGELNDNRMKELALMIL